MGSSKYQVPTFEADQSNEDRKLQDHAQDQQPDVLLRESCHGLNPEDRHDAESDSELETEDGIDFPDEVHSDSPLREGVLVLILVG